MMRGQKAKKRVVDPRNISRSYDRRQWWPMQLANRFAGMQSTNPPNYTSTIQTQLLQYMEKQEEIIYRIRQGNTIEVREQESRILNNKTAWKINYSERWEQILQSIQSSTVKILQIKNNNTLKMFKIVSSIKFYQLIEVNFSGIDLTSTQPLLCLTSLPLQYIRLNSNKLCNIKSIRKMYFPKIKQLILYGNLIIDCSPLNELYGDKTNLTIQLTGATKQPQVFHMRRSYYKNCVQNYMPLFKLPKSTHFVINPPIAGINSTIVFPMLHHKYRQ